VYNRWELDVGASLFSLDLEMTSHGAVGQCDPFSDWRS